MKTLLMKAEELTVSRLDTKITAILFGSELCLITNHARTPEEKLIVPSIGYRLL